MAITEPGQLFVFDQPTEKAWADARQIRNLFTALAQTNYTTDAAYPSAPRAGMARLNASDPNNIKLEFWQGSPGAWRTSLQNIQGGVPAPIKQIVQITAAATVWTIDHNLGNYAIAWNPRGSGRNGELRHWWNASNRRSDCHRSYSARGAYEWRSHHGRQCLREGQR